MLEFSLLLLMVLCQSLLVQCVPPVPDGAGQPWEHCRGGDVGTGVDITDGHFGHFGDLQCIKGDGDESAHSVEMGYLGALAGSCDSLMLRGHVDHWGLGDMTLGSRPVHRGIHMDPGSLSQLPQAGLLRGATSSPCLTRFTTSV